MRLGHVEIFVADPIRSLAFWRDAIGFEVVDVQGGRFVWLRSGAALVLLRPGANPAPSETYQRAPIALVLYTDDLQAAAARLAGHAVPIRGDDGPGCLTFCDPDGHWLQLVDND
jgi:catechol 2,3-dioxygenase-like lactoylglutathione lyase family enzyme